VCFQSAEASHQRRAQAESGEAAVLAPMQRIFWKVRNLFVSDDVHCQEKHIGIYIPFTCAPATAYSTGYTKGLRATSEGYGYTLRCTQQTLAHLRVDFASEYKTVLTSSLSPGAPPELCWTFPLLLATAAAAGDAAVLAVAALGTSAAGGEEGRGGEDFGRQGGQDVSSAA